MPYQYVHGISMEDIAFQATGQTLQELFMSASDAVMQVMISDLNEIAFQEKRTIELSEKSLDLLLCQFLNELVYYKDAQNLLLRCFKIDIQQEPEHCQLQALLRGEAIDRAKHRLKTDIKAITFYRLQVRKNSKGWQASVVIDV